MLQLRREFQKGLFGARENRRIGLAKVIDGILDYIEEVRGEVDFWGPIPALAPVTTAQFGDGFVIILSA